MQAWVKSYDDCHWLTKEYLASYAYDLQSPNTVGDNPRQRPEWHQEWRLVYRVQKCWSVRIPLLGKGRRSLTKVWKLISQGSMLRLFTTIKLIDPKLEKVKQREEERRKMEEDTSSWSGWGRGWVMMMGLCSVLTTSDFSEKMPSVKASGESHFTGSLTPLLFFCLK